MQSDSRTAAKESLLDSLEMMIEGNPAVRRAALRVAYSSGVFDGLVQMARVGQPEPEQYTGTLIADLYELVEDKEKLDA